jgi:hypothetical protein
LKKRTESAFTHRWAPKWPPIVILLATAAGFAYIGGGITDLPVVFNVVLLGLGAVALAGAVAGTMSTTVTATHEGDLHLRHDILAVTVFRRRFAAADVVRIAVREIPLRVGPGRRPRSTYALDLHHAGGVQPILLDDDRARLEAPATQLAAALGRPLDLGRPLP